MVDFIVSGRYLSSPANACRALKGLPDSKSHVDRDALVIAPIVLLRRFRRGRPALPPTAKHQNIPPVPCVSSAALPFGPVTISTAATTMLWSANSHMHPGAYTHRLPLVALMAFVASSCGGTKKTTPGDGGARDSAAGGAAGSSDTGGSGSEDSGAGGSVACLNHGTGADIIDTCNPQSESRVFATSIRRSVAPGTPTRPRSGRKW